MKLIPLFCLIPNLLFCELSPEALEKKLVSLMDLIEKEPTNPSAAFQLGETCKSLGFNGTAIKWYEKSITLGNSNEELWRSRLSLGKSYAEIKQTDKAVNSYLQALNIYPKRAEPYYELARHFRLHGNNDLSLLYAKQGKALSLPKERSPFISKEVYDFLLDEELSIAAFYTPERELGYQALNRLLLNKQAPWYTKNQALNNAIYYAKPLKAILKPVDIILPKINDQENYNSMNPSIQRTDGGYEIVCRTVNYGQKNAKHFWSRDPNNSKIITRNFLIKTDKDFKRLSQEEIVDKSVYERFPWWFAEGKEDCRIFRFKGENWFTSSLVDANPTNTIQIGLGRLGKDAAITHMTPLKGPDPKRCEKNWLPFAYKNEIHAIYGYDPFIVFKVDPSTGATKKVIETSSNLDTSRFRGSAGPIPFENGYLVLVHEVAYTDHRYYLHRFIYLDKNFKITKASPLFTIKTVGIEYCSGMTWDHAGKNVVITLGVEDSQAFIALVDKEEVKGSLRY